MGTACGVRRASRSALRAARFSLFARGAAVIERGVLWLVEGLGFPPIPQRARNGWGTEGFVVGEDALGG